MGITADLATRLDATALVGDLRGEFGESVAALRGITLPGDDGQAAAAGGRIGSIDVGGLGTTIDRVARAVGPMLAALPGPGEAVASLTSAVELLESATTQDLPRQVRELVERLAEELRGRRDGSPVDALTRLVELLATAPQGEVLTGVLSGFLRTAGADPGSASLPVADLFAGFRSAIDAVGGLMSLESALAEADRLSALLASQLDPEAVATEVRELLACCGEAGHVAGEAPRPPGVPSHHEHTAGELVDECFDRLDRLARSIAESMGLGEATLVYLDVGRLQSEVERAAAMVHAADVDPLARAAEWVAGRLRPLLDLGPAAGPARTLAGLLEDLESRVGEVTGSIAAADVADVARPVVDAIGRISTASDLLASRITGATVGIRSGLERIRAAVAELPIADVAEALRAILAPVREVLDLLRDAVAAVESAVAGASAAVTAAAGRAEQAIDRFRAAIEAQFQALDEFIAGLDLEGRIGQVADGARAFADELAKAHMKPIFDAAVDAIGTTADVVEKVPFAMLPDSMLSEVAEAIRPIKQVDVGQVEAEIETLLQIEPGGSFALRPKLEAAVAGVQAKYDELIAEVAKFDVNALVDTIDAELRALAAQVGEISPKVALEPLKGAIAALKGAVADLDLDALLAPLREAFGRVLAAVEEFSPAQLLAPIEGRFDAARDALFDALKLRDWTAQIDELVAATFALIDRLDPAPLEAQIHRAFAEARAVVERFPSLEPAEGLGGLVAGLLAGRGLRVHPWSFEVVIGWLRGASGAGALTGRAGRVADAIARTRVAVAAIDPQEIAARVTPQIQSLRDAIAAMPPEAPDRDRLQEGVDRIDPARTLGPLAANRGRYLAALERAEAEAQTLRRTGLSEADATIVRLRGALDPARSAFDGLRAMLGRLGVPGLDRGLAEVVRGTLASAPPERVASILVPVATALRGRLVALVDALARPLKDGVTRLLALAEAIDLTSLREALDAPFQEVKRQVEALHPDRLLGDALTSFAALRSEVATFDPLAAVEAALLAMREGTQRLLGKLNAREILALPLRIYTELVALLGRLDLAALLAPVLEQLDTIATQVDEGLDRTVDAFRRLQEGLPSESELSAGASAGASVSFS